MKRRILCDVAFEILCCCNNLYIEQHLFFCQFTQSANTVVLGMVMVMVKTFKNLQYNSKPDKSTQC